MNRIRNRNTCTTSYDSGKSSVIVRHEWRAYTDNTVTILETRQNLWAGEGSMRRGDGTETKLEWEYEVRKKGMTTKHRNRKRNEKIQKYARRDSHANCP
jgi:hypothetical protein